MMKTAIRYVVVFLVGIAFWVAASRVLNTPEPWDSPQYLAWCLAAVGLAALFGWIFPARAWLWGVLIIFAQLPVMMVQSQAGPLLLAGLGILGLQAIPACLAAMAASKAKAMFLRRRT